MNAPTFTLLALLAGGGYVQPAPQPMPQLTPQPAASAPELPTAMLRASATHHERLQPAPLDCLAPRYRADLDAYNKQLLPQTAQPPQSVQAQRAGVGTCSTTESFTWSSDTDPFRARTQWLAELERSGGGTVWENLMPAHFNLFGLEYGGKYYFLKWSAGPETTLTIIGTRY